VRQFKPSMQRILAPVAKQPDLTLDQMRVEMRKLQIRTNPACFGAYSNTIHLQKRTDEGHQATWPERVGGFRYAGYAPTLICF
jgi:hypothetical protein